MHLKCRITRLAATSRPSRACGNGTRHGGHLASHSRSFSGSCVALGTNRGHARPCARHQDNIATRPAYLLLQPNNALAGASSMELLGNVPTTLYDWRAFTAPGAQLHYIRTEDTANERIARIASRQTPFAIGLDFEWRPTFVSGRAENPIALVQVACDDEILLVHVSAMRVFPTKLRDLLESSISTKVGVGIQYDCKKLWRDHRVSVRNCVDLALLARSVDKRWKGPYKNSIGLSRLAEVYLGRYLPKGDTQRSNWEMELSTRQREYAANDSHSALAIYQALTLQAPNLTPGVEPECFTFDTIDGALRDDQGRPWFPFNPHYDPGTPPSLPVSD